MIRCPALSKRKCGIIVVYNAQSFWKIKAATKGFAGNCIINSIAESVAVQQNVYHHVMQIESDKLNNK